MKKQFFLYFMVGTMTASCLNMSCARDGKQEEETGTSVASDSLDYDSSAAVVDTANGYTSGTTSKKSSPMNTDGTH